MISYNYKRELKKELKQQKKLIDINEELKAKPDSIYIFTSNCKNYK